MASGDPPVGWTLNLEVGLDMFSIVCLQSLAKGFWRFIAGEPLDHRQSESDGPDGPYVRCCRLVRSHIFTDTLRKVQSYAVLESVKVIEAEANSILHRPFGKLRAVTFCDSCTLTMRFDSTNDDGLLSIRGG